MFESRHSESAESFAPLGTMKLGYTFLTVEQVLAIHARVIDEFGGTPEVRDHGLLESAVFMPQAKFDGQYLHDGVPAMATAYFFHLCKNHAFVDGNKRTALATSEIFIRLNHYRLVATDDQLEAITLGVASSAMDKNSLTQSFRKRVRRTSADKKKHKKKLRAALVDIDKNYGRTMKRLAE